jgi:hypothetical protein
MKTVVSYLAGVPSSHKNGHKTEFLKRFVGGVNRVNDRGIAHQGIDLIPCDVAILQGWVHEGSPNTPHLLLRKKVFEFQKNNGKQTIIVDSNLFNYKNKEHPIKYLRYGMGGVFPTTANYFWNNPDPKRWQQISSHLGIPLRDWRTSGSHVLICTQRNGGWSMKGLDVTQWLEETVDKIKQFTDRPIIVRGHPGDKSAKTYLQSKKGRYIVSTNENIVDDFKNAWAVITYNSSPGVASSIEGIPAFITDPNPEVSQAYPVGNYDLSKLENPELKDRQNWIERLAMCHWHFGELDDGSAWTHMKSFIPQ